MITYGPPVDSMQCRTPPFTHPPFAPERQSADGRRRDVFANGLQFKDTLDDLKNNQ